MTDYFSEKFFDGLIKVAKQVDDENQENFKKLEDELKTAQTQYGKVVQQNKDLQTELNTVKQQYNCYACGRCKGKEDYVNLEKHHLGLRKQFDELYRHKGELVTAYSKENKKAILYKAALEKIRTACQYYIADERNLTPEQIIVMINEVLK